jgi:hypothetical protein
MLPENKIDMNKKKKQEKGLNSLQHLVTINSM